jgi:outer membrane biosynthesis protein TonB
MVRIMTSLLFVTALHSMCLLAESPVVLDEDVRVVSFAEMEYPIVAKLKSEQGIVVVRVTFDSRGIVRDARALSGPRYLIDSAVGNARKWVFHPSKESEAIVLYDFRIEETCQNPCRSQFLFRRPNVAIIRKGHLLVNPAH